MLRSLNGARHNSWSDTGRDKGPTGRRSSKGGVSGLAEDLRPVSEVEAGVKFSVGWRCTGAGCRFTSQEATRHRYQEGQVVTPSLHPQVLDTRFMSPGRGLGIRQSMGWTMVCHTAHSGIWVLKGNARTCMLPENLDLQVGMDFSGIIRDRLGYARARLSVSISVWTWSSCQTTN